MKDFQNTKKPSTSTPKNTSSVSQSHKHVDFTRLSSVNILDLQRMVGNKTTQQMVQRANLGAAATAPPPEQHQYFNVLEGMMRGKVNRDEINAAVGDVVRFLADNGINLNGVQLDGLYAAAPDPRAMAAIAFGKG